jgi:ABC-type multidrug transport system ATPase subunit
MPVKQLDLQVPRHLIFGFLGPNGASKRTTIRLLLGLAKPTDGSATIFGHALYHRQPCQPQACWLPGPGPALL